MGKLPYTKDAFPEEAGEYSYGIPRVIKYQRKCTLKIGKFCSIADDVLILIGGDHRLDWVTTFPLPLFIGRERRKKLGYSLGSAGSVIIGNDVWIGNGVVIVSDVTIGDGACIGARSVVAKDVPPYAVVVGNPARVIKMRFPDDVVKKLLQISWWNWELEKILKLVPVLCQEDPNRFIKAVT